MERLIALHYVIGSVSQLHTTSSRSLVWACELNSAKIMFDSHIQSVPYLQALLVPYATLSGDYYISPFPTPRYSAVDSRQC